MNIQKETYRDFDIEVSASPSNFADLWIGHDEIVRTNFGIASASVSGPNTSHELAVKHALLQARQFVDEILRSSG